MKIVLNIGNRLEVARMSARAVDQILSEVRALPDLTQRCDHIVARVNGWQSLFPQTAGIAALTALNTSLKLQAASGRAGIEVLQCARIVEHMESEAVAEAKRKRQEAAKMRYAVIRQTAAERQKAQ